MLPKPASEDQFEAMCRALYAEIWADPTCMRVGRRGQFQGGVDILGMEKGEPVGAQCKFYDRTKFTYATVLDDVAKVEQSGIPLRRLYFATTAAPDATLVHKVHELNVRRTADRLFTISIHAWDQLCAYIQSHPKVGQDYIPEFPGGMLFEIRDTSREALDILRNLSKGVMAKPDILPLANGAETDPRVAAGLDVVREALLGGRTDDARAALERLGSPNTFPDAFSKFRWHTNKAAIELHDGATELAVENYLAAYRLAPRNEKAHVNRCHALLLKKDASGALQAAEDALLSFPANPTLWSILVIARDALGTNDAMDGIPKSVADSDDVRFARARIARNRGNYESAIDILEAMLADDDPSGQVKRTYLADALEWATKDTALALQGHISARQRSALMAAVELFEPIEACVARSQSRAVAEELASNIATALVMLGKDGRAQIIIKIGLDLHPASEMLIRLRLMYLIEHGSKEEVLNLLQASSESISNSALAVAAEFAATRGEVEWCLSLIEAAAVRDPCDRNLRDLKLLAYQARFANGETSLVIDELECYVASNEHHLMARLLLAQVLKRSGKAVDARRVMEELVPYLRGSDVGSADIVNAADLLFGLGSFEHAGELYDRVIRHPADDAITVKFLICLIETGQRKKVRDTLEQMDSVSRASGEVRRIEANLAAQSGNWRDVRRLLEEELAERPGSVKVATGYATALHHLGLQVELANFLLTDPSFDNSDLDEEFEFAKLQARAGLPLLGANRMLRVFAANPTSVKAASLYLTQVMLSRLPGDAFQLPTVSDPCAVRLHGERGDWVVAIGTRSEIGCWPEVIPSRIPVAASLLGRQVGQSVSVERDGLSQPYEIVEIQTPLAFVAGKASDLLAAANTREGPLWSSNILENDGSMNVDVLISQARARREHVERVFEVFGKSRYPLAVLANLLGSDLVSLYLDWPSSLLPLFVGVESPNGNVHSACSIVSGGGRSVLDLAVVIELTRLSLFESAAGVMPRAAIPSSNRELLREILDMHQLHKPTATIAEREGRLHIADLAADAYDARTRLLQQALQNIDRYLEVLPVVGPSEAPAELRAVCFELGRATADVLMLCLEQESILVCDDGGLSSIAGEFGISSRTNLQGILKALLQSGEITPLMYAEFLLSKIQRGHEFIAMSPEDLIELAVGSPRNKVEAALGSLSAPEIDSGYAASVVCEFLRLAARRLAAAEVGPIAQAALRALTAERQDQAKELEALISQVLIKHYGRNGRRLKPCERRAFGVLLARR